MSENYLMAVMAAVINSTEAGSNQQLTDSNSTMLNVKLEQQEYNEWTEKVQAQAKSVNYWAGKVAKDPTNKAYQARLTATQTNWQNTMTEEQTNTQQADSMVQASQNQAGQDSTNVQQKVQLEAAINQILQTLSSALAARY